MKLLTCSKLVWCNVMFHVKLCRLWEHYDEGLGPIQIQSFILTFSHHNVDQLLQFFFCFCNYYGVSSIPQIIDHSATNSETSLSSLFLMMILVYNANRCGKATQPCRMPCLMFIDSLTSGTGTLFSGIP